MAAVLLPERHVVLCLRDVVRDRREEESVRRAACDAILKHCDEGRRLLAELAEDDRVPRRTRGYIGERLW
jgi:uncharacterized protein (UPF0147 family)